MKPLSLFLGCPANMPVVEVLRNIPKNNRVLDVENLTDEDRINIIMESLNDGIPATAGIYNISAVTLHNWVRNLYGMKHRELKIKHEAGEKLILVEKDAKKDGRKEHIKMCMYSIQYGVNAACKKYDVSQGSITYWFRKYFVSCQSVYRQEYMQSDNKKGYFKNFKGLKK